MRAHLDGDGGMQVVERSQNLRCQLSGGIGLESDDQSLRNSGVTDVVGQRSDSRRFSEQAPCAVEQDLPGGGQRDMPTRPDEQRGVEGADYSPGFNLDWWKHPHANAAQVCASGVWDLMAPQSPEADRWKTIGHFPMSENHELFRTYLIRALDVLKRKTQAVAAS